MEITFVLTTVETALGGIARSVPALASAVARAGVPTRVLAVEAPRMTVAPGLFAGEGSRLCRNRAELRAELAHWAAQAGPDRILYHAGVWDPLNHYVARLGRARGIPVIASSRSMLDPWALRHRRWKKRAAWWLYARRDFLGAAAVHATADLEARHVRAAGYGGPLMVVPNGIDFPRNPPPRPERPPGAPRRILFLSRIHAKKGLPDLITAFARSAPPDWELIIAGNDDGGHESACRALAARQPSAAARIRFHGPVADTDKWALYGSADLFVLPSYSENFGLVVGEALAAGVPVITTTATPWEELPRRGCGWCIPTGTDALAGSLETACALPAAERAAMGARGAAWVREAFGWDGVGQRFAAGVKDLRSNLRGRFAT
ncbi:MAG: glycosyltransferase [Opitutales bacterium]|nr:glycosyltransferase [Opitutales bacterium]